MVTHSYKQSSLKRTDTVKKELPSDLPSFIKVKRCLQEASVPYLVPFIKVKRCLHEVSVPYLVTKIGIATYGLCTLFHKQGRLISIQYLFRLLTYTWR